MGEAKEQQAAAAAAAQQAQRAQQLAEASRATLADLERALDAREAKLQDSWKTFKAQMAHLEGGAGLLLYSDQRLKVRRCGFWCSGGLGRSGCAATPLDARLYAASHHAAFSHFPSVPKQDDAQAAAVEAAGRSPSPLPSVTGATGGSPDLVRVLHQRRTQLVERETALQRWAVALELEAARQTAAAQQLKAQEGKAGALAAESASNKEAAQALLADVQRREAALQRDASEVQAQQQAAQRERQELASERAGLEAAAADLSERAADIGRREQQLGAAEEQWMTKMQQAEVQLKVLLGWAELLVLQGGAVALRQGSFYHAAAAQSSHLPLLLRSPAGGQRGGSAGAARAACAGGARGQAVGA